MPEVAFRGVYIIRITLDGERKKSLIDRNSSIQLNFIACFKMNEYDHSSIHQCMEYNMKSCMRLGLPDIQDVFWVNLDVSSFTASVCAAF